MQKGLSLLIYLSPDKTNSYDITAYLCGAATLQNRRKVQTLICHLRKNGWDIGFKTYSLPQDQYDLVQRVYREPALRNRIRNNVKLTPEYLHAIANQCGPG